MQTLKPNFLMKNLLNQYFKEILNGIDKVPDSDIVLYLEQFNDIINFIKEDKEDNKIQND